MLPIDGEEMIENNSDHREGAEHVGEEVEGVMGDHLAVWGSSSTRAGMKECMSGWSGRVNEERSVKVKVNNPIQIEMNYAQVNTGVSGLWR